MEKCIHRWEQIFLKFTDDFSGYTFVYFLKNKSEIPKCFKEFVTLAEKQKEGVQKSYAQKDILRHLTAPYNPQQNGVSERKNRTIFESAICMLHYAGLSYKS